MAPAAISTPATASSLRIRTHFKCAVHSRTVVRAKAAVAEAGTNAAEARAWIEAWRSKQSSVPKAVKSQKATASDVISYSASDLSKVNLEEALAKLAKN